MYSGWTNFCLANAFHLMQNGFIKREDLKVDIMFYKITLMPVIEQSNGTHFDRKECGALLWEYKISRSGEQ